MTMLPGMVTPRAADRLFKHKQTPILSKLPGRKPQTWQFFANLPGLLLRSLVSNSDLAGFFLHITPFIAWLSLSGERVIMSESVYNQA